MFNRRDSRESEPKPRDALRRDSTHRLEQGSEMAHSRKKL